MKKIIVDKEYLYNEYIIKNKTLQEIADELKLSKKTIQRKLKLFGINKKREKSDYDNKEWLYNEYINKNKRIREIAKEYDITEAMVKKRLCKFGIKKDKEKCNELIEETILKKHGVKNILELKENRKKAKKAIKEKYGVDSFSQTDFYKQNIKLYKEKEHETKRKNKSFNTSKIEDKVYEILNKYFKVERNKIIDKYNCDFYIPEYDLYVEFNGHWTHGKEIFNYRNKNHLMIIENWKSKNTGFYDRAIYVWTQKDPEKRKFMVDNEINFLEIFNFISEEDLLNQIRRVI